MDFFKEKVVPLRYRKEQREWIFFACAAQLHYCALLVQDRLLIVASVQLHFVTVEDEV